MVLRETEKVRFLNYLFKDDALTFYREEVEKNNTTNKEAITCIEEEFIPHTKQKKLYRSLRSLRFRDFRERLATKTEELDKFSDHILSNTESSRDVPYGCKKSEFLRDAVNGKEWTRIVFV